MKKLNLTNWKIVAIGSATLMACTVARPALAISTGSNIDDVTDTVSDVREGALEDDTLVRFFDEGQTQLSSDLTVDASSPDDVGNDLSGGTGTESVISQGTTVNSYYFHFDQVGDSSSTTTGSDTNQGDAASFTVTFDNPIAGLRDCS